MPYGVYRRIWDFFPVSYNILFYDYADIYHFFNYIVPPQVKGKVIDTIYDMSYKLFPETLNASNLKRIKKDILYSVNRSNIIITISENSKREIIEEFSIDENMVHIIYPAYEKLYAAQSYEEITKRFSIGSDYILYLGNLEPRKNLSRLITAYGRLKRDLNVPYKLVIAGQKGWLYDSIFKTIEALNLQDSIVFTGYITSEEKASLYKHALLFVFPSLYEGFGIPILEAMSLGTPVVCSNTSSMPEAAGDGAYFVNPLDEISIAEGIYKITTNTELREEKIKNGFIQASKFSWEKSVQELENIYLQL